jgi:hypothetical protein
MSQTECDFIEACPIFQYFKRTAKKVYMRMYCRGEYHDCHRYRLRVAGEFVPENLMPHGGTLWDEERQDRS